MTYKIGQICRYTVIGCRCNPDRNYRLVKIVSIKLGGLIVEGIETGDCGSILCVNSASRFFTKQRLPTHNIILK